MSSVDDLRSREAGILLKIERYSQSLQRLHPDWPAQKCDAESWLAQPKLYERYLTIREELIQRKVRPLIPRDNR
jgi:hypothetical protein